MNKRLPLGIQSFEKIRNEDFLYIDKTEYIYKMVHTGVPFFLSRPRRFGKSLLLSTINAYWLGKKELFAGLKIEELEKNNADAWQEYPVFYFDFNKDNYNRQGALFDVLSEHLNAWEEKYGIEKESSSLPERFRLIIEKAVQITGKNVVILVDEYDKPLLESIDNSDLEEDNKELFKGFFSTLKSYDRYIKFVLFTGVTKFSKISIFSDLNQLTDISMNKEYASICGITEDEIKDSLMPEVMELAEVQKISCENCLARLKSMYDGYHFHQDSDDIYNPYSLLSALYEKEFESYWFSTGTPSFLIHKIKNTNFDVKLITEGKLFAERLSIMDYHVDNPNVIPLFYQTGYLTIKGYDNLYNALRLDYPNDEVKYGFLKSLAPLMLDNSEGLSPLEVRAFIKDIEEANLDGIRDRFITLFESLPYTNSDKPVEQNFQNVIYIVFILLGQFVKVESHSANGRADCIVENDKNVFIFEFKRDKSSDEALDQIRTNTYFKPYLADPRKVWGIGVNFSTEIRNIAGWKVVEDYK